MAKYMYQAKNAAGQKQMGQLEGADEAEIRLKIKAMNMVPLNIILVPGSRAQKKEAFFKRRVSSKDLQIFTRQFSTLINAGISLVDALNILAQGKKTAMMKSTIMQVKTSIEGGKRLGDSMAMAPHVFDRLYVNMVRAGEEAGILDNILNRLSAYIEKSEKLRKQVMGAMMYPAIVIVLAGLVIAAILIFVIPQFQEFYKAGGKDLPAITQAVVTLSDLLLTRWYVFLAVAIGGPIGFYLWYNTPDGKDVVDRALIRMPLFGELVQKSAVAKMTRTLSTLLSSGVNVIEAIDIAAKTSGNSVIEDALIRCKESVTSGKPLAAPLLKEKMIPDMVTQMISIGEQSGTLDSMLSKIADFYEDDVEAAVKGLTSLIEPLLMVVLGGIIAGLVAAMYLPIFNMANVVGGQ